MCVCEYTAITSTINNRRLKNFHLLICKFKTLFFFLGEIFYDSSFN